jgi:hypothetical protein
MAASAGPAPWKAKDYQKFKAQNAEKYNNFESQFKRRTAKQQAAAGHQWSLSSGWREAKATDWNTLPNKSKYKTIRLYNGKSAYVPDGDFEDYFRYRAPGPDEGQIKSNEALEKYVNEAKWSQNVKPPDGHIVSISYAPTRQLLQVEFLDGAVVVFFRVPKEVYSELKYLAGDGTAGGMPGSDDKYGVFRHDLGRRFWDIVRIRGTLQGSRYPYEYTTAGERVDKEAKILAKFDPGKTVADGTLTGRYGKEEGSMRDDIDTFKQYKNMLNAKQKEQFAEFEKLDDVKEQYKKMSVFLVQAGIIEPEDD